MKYVLAAALFMAFSSTAVAQEATAPPTAEVPPSACPALTPGPTAPDPARATADQMNAAVAGYSAWQSATQASVDCRNAERRALNAQLQARTSELQAAQTANQAAAAAFQAQLDAFHARRSRR